MLYNDILMVCRYKKINQQIFSHLIYKTLMQVKKNTVIGQTHLNPNTGGTLHDATLHRNQIVISYGNISMYYILIPIFQ